MSANNLRGYLIGIGGGLVLSTDAVFIKLMQLENAWTLVACRGLLMWGVFLLMYALSARLRPIIGTPWLTRNNLLSVLLFAVASATFVLALTQGAIASVLVIISSTPFISALLGRVLFGEPIDRAMLVAAGFGMLGVLVVMSGSSPGAALQANYFALATAVAMALAFLCSARVQGGSAGLPSLGALLAGLFALGAQYAPPAELTSLASQPRALWVGIEGGLVIPLALGSLALSTRYIAAANTGLFLLLETALAPLWIWLVFQEAPAVSALIGGAIIVSTVLCHFVVTWRRVRAERPLQSYAQEG